MIASFQSGYLREISFFAQILSYDASRENVNYFCHSAVIRNNSNYPEFI